MTEPIHIAFEKRIITLPLSALLPRKQVTESQKKTVKYRRIVSSIAEIGIIEPLIISPLNKRGEQYLLIDGHLRLSALRDIGQSEARCLITDDDEGFTYNKRINHLATVQEYFMIMRALKNGVSEEKLAKVLNVDIKLIKRRRTMLDGICPEVVDMLKDKSVTPLAFEVLRKMKPLRQIEVAELMSSAANWTSTYAKALLAATRQDDLAKPDQPKKVAGMTSEQMARMEREMASLHQDFKQIEDSYGDDVLHLVTATAYLSKLVSNKEIERYLSRDHKELLDEFRLIISATSLDQTGLAA